MRDDSPDLVVIVPVFNGAATIGDQLEALTRQRCEASWFVLVVDNGSTDTTRDIVAEFVARQPTMVELAEAADRHNLSYVRNEGVRRSESRNVAFCDADDMVGDGWVAGIVDALAHHPLVGSKMDYLRLNDRTARYQTESVESIFGVPVIGGGGLACRRALWERLGGNDERFLAEDTEFCIRAYRELGVRPVLAEATYHCRMRGAPRTELRRCIRQARSEVQLFEKYGSASYRPSAKRVVRTWLAAVRSLRDIRSVDGRMRAARLWGSAIGRLRGSLENRTPYL